MQSLPEDLEPQEYHRIWSDTHKGKLISRPDGIVVRLDWYIGEGVWDQTIWFAANKDLINTAVRGRVDVSWAVFV